jgi:hypothetical protein
MTFDPRPRALLSPEPGFWLVRLAKGAPLVPAAILRVHTTHEPGNPGNAMERSPFLAAEIAGETCDIDAVWLRKGEPITESEYRFRCADAAHARQWRPDEPQAQPRKAVDWMTAPLPF